MKRLKSVETSLLYLARYQQIHGRAQQELIPFGEVVSWHFATFLKTNTLELGSFSTLRCFAVGHDVAQDFRLKGSTGTQTVCVGNDVPLLSDLTGEERFDFLFLIVSKAMAEIAPEVAQREDVIARATQSLRSNGFAVKWVHSRKFLRAMNASISIESRMGIGGCLVFAVIHQDDVEVASRHIETAPATMRSVVGRFNKIEVDQDTVYLRDDLNNGLEDIDIHGSLFLRDPQPDSYYKWSMPLADIKRTVK
ncbi:hypothetical protein [uncultured Tateyamaria sp.]|uniref:hypothetical protein n=1 Tax=Tateyamaria sp. 1078 TaxID=3417464 RepID=UPI00260B367B|nr:hypothetical protein [uncultured Tateyamaria sp.]